MHSLGHGSHYAFGVHQEPFHGLYFAHHGYYNAHYYDHFYLGSYIGYSLYPRYGYSNYGYGAYDVPVPYATPTVVVTRPAVTDTDSTPVPTERSAAPEGAPEMVPGEGAALPREEPSTSGPAWLRAPLIETSEAPEVLPPLPGVRNPK